MPGHQLSFTVYVAVTHVEATVFGHTSDERAKLNISAFVGCPHHLLLLSVMEPGAGVHLAIRRVHLRSEVSIIIINAADD